MQQHGRAGGRRWCLLLQCGQLGALRRGLAVVATLHEHRRRRYLTQRELAAAAGVAAATIAQIELGKHPPHLRTRRKIAAALGVHPDAIDWPESSPGADAGGADGAPPRR